MKQAELLVINEYCFYESKTKLLAFLTFLTKRGIKNCQLTLVTLFCSPCELLATQLSSASILSSILCQVTGTICVVGIWPHSLTTSLIGF